MFGRRLRARLDRIEGNAHYTMNSAQELIGAIEDLVADIQDGVDVELVRHGEATFMQFVMGEVDSLPFRVRIKIEEDDEAQQ